MKNTLKWLPMTLLIFGAVAAQATEHAAQDAQVLLELEVDDVSPTEDESLTALEMNLQSRSGIKILATKNAAEKNVLSAEIGDTFFAPGGEPNCKVSRKKSAHGTGVNYSIKCKGLDWELVLVGSGGASKYTLSALRLKDGSFDSVPLATAWLPASSE